MICKKCKQETNVVCLCGICPKCNGIDKVMRKEFLEYISKRGFRESNYEVTELIKWLSNTK